MAETEKNCSFVDFDHCIRLYDENGKHCLSIVRCTADDDDGFDYVTPDGKLVWADESHGYFVEFLTEHFPVSLARDP